MARYTRGASMARSASGTRHQASCCVRWRSSSRETMQRLKRKLPPHILLFSAIWLFIAFVSVHDGYLMAIHRAVHRQGQLELNPVARYLILARGGTVWLLLAA